MTNTRVSRDLADVNLPAGASRREPYETLQLFLLVRHRARVSSRVRVRSGARVYPPRRRPRGRSRDGHGTPTPGPSRGCRGYRCRWRRGRRVVLAAATAAVAPPLPETRRPCQASRRDARAWTASPWNVLAPRRRVACARFLTLARFAAAAAASAGRDTAGRLGARGARCTTPRRARLSRGVGVRGAQAARPRRLVSFASRGEPSERRFVGRVGRDSHAGEVAAKEFAPDGVGDGREVSTGTRERPGLDALEDVRREFRGKGRRARGGADARVGVEQEATHDLVGNWSGGRRRGRCVVVSGRRRCPRASARSPIAPDPPRASARARLILSAAIVVNPSWGRTDCRKFQARRGTSSASARVVRRLFTSRRPTESRERRLRATHAARPPRASPLDGVGEIFARDATRAAHALLLPGETTLIVGRLDVGPGGRKGRLRWASPDPSRRPPR